MKTSLCDALLQFTFVFGCQRAWTRGRDAPRGAGTRVPGLKPGGADRSRTDDIQLAKLALYQLSYSPKPSTGVGRWWA